MTLITSGPEAMYTGAPDETGTSGLTVAVASDLSLLAEAVGAALASRRLKVVQLAWPGVPRDDPTRRQLARLKPDVALLLYDVDMSIRMAQASALLRDWSGPWLVLTGSAPGAAWGGLRAAGAAAVRPNDTGLEEVEGLIRILATGRRAPCADSLDTYVDAWRFAQLRHSELQQRLDNLTPRERQVLDLLRRGVRVRAIAGRLGLSESTVRSQVRAVLRKLGVRSQLAAVALLRAIDELE